MHDLFGQSDLVANSRQRNFDFSIVVFCCGVKEAGKIGKVDIFVLDEDWVGISGTTLVEEGSNFWLFDDFSSEF